MSCRELTLAVACSLIVLGGQARAQPVQPFAPPAPLVDLPEMGTAEGAEEEDEIETDRDSFTPATTTAGYDRLIIESAWSFIDNRDVPETNSFPELIARYGVNDWLELRLGWNYEVGGASNTISGDAGESEEPSEVGLEEDSKILYGLKVGLTSQYDLRPQSAVILQASTPTSGEDTATQMFATYVAGWELSNRWKWDSAIR